MKIALCPFLITIVNVEDDNLSIQKVCNERLGEAIETFSRRWICPIHGQVGGDKVVNWEYEGSD
jgi:hypothetical protein